MASKQDVYLVLEAVRLLSEDVSSLHKKVDTGSELVAEVAGLKGVVAGLAGKLEEVLAGLRGSAEVLQELKAAELRDRLDMLEMKWSVTQMGDVARTLFAAMKSLEKPEWLLYIEVFGAGFHQPGLAMALIGAAMVKGDPFWMLLACFLSFFLSPYLTCLWCFSLLVWRCGWMRRKCMRSTGCGGSPSSKRSSSRNSNRNSSFLSNLGSRRTLVHACPHSPSSQCLPLLHLQPGDLNALLIPPTEVMLNLLRLMLVLVMVLVARLNSPISLLFRPQHL